MPRAPAALAIVAALAIAPSAVRAGEYGLPTEVQSILSMWQAETHTGTVENSIVAGDYGVVDFTDDQGAPKLAVFVRTPKAAGTHQGWQDDGIIAGPANLCVLKADHIPADVASEIVAHDPRLASSRRQAC